jgi:preprotein translocase subunit SecD
VIGSAPETARARVVDILTPEGTVTATMLQETIQVIDRRLERSGIANWTVHEQGNEVVIELSGANGDPAVLNAVAQTGELFFRPVDCIIPPYARPRSTTTVVVSTPVARATTTTPPSNTTIPAATTTTTSLGTAICRMTAAQQATYTPPHGDAEGETPPQYDLFGSTVVLAYYASNTSRYVLGPAEMSGSVVHAAAANLNSQTDQWEVDLTFTGKGSDEFNKYAMRHYQCYEEDAQDPPYCALQAIELDGIVESAPSVEAATYNGAATISGSTKDPFTAAQVTALADALNYGALPVRFAVTQEVTYAKPTSEPAT